MDPDPSRAAGPDRGRGRDPRRHQTGIWMNNNPYRSTPTSLRTSPWSGNGPELSLARPHPIVARVVLDLGQAQGLHERRDVHAEPPPVALPQPVPPPHRIVRRAGPRLYRPLGRGLLLV